MSEKSDDQSEDIKEGSALDENETNSVDSEPLESTSTEQVQVDDSELQTSKVEDSVLDGSEADEDDSTDSEVTSEVEDSVLDGSEEDEADSIDSEVTSEVEDSVLDGSEADEDDSIEFEVTSEVEDSVLDGSEEDEADSIDSEVTSKVEDSVMDETEEDEADSIDSEVASEVEDSVLDGSEADEDEFAEPKTLDLTWVGNIQESLTSVSAKIDRLENPTDRKLSQAKGLILMLSGITGIVMIASITFFVVMAMSISQKVAELDRVLMAVAKRGIQLGDGIETIVGMESKLVEVIEQNNPIPSSLSNIESQLITNGQALIEEKAETRSALKNQAASIMTRQNSIKDELGAEFDGLERRVNELINLKPLLKEHSELKKQLESLSQAVLNMESKIQDLYIIKQAEMENAYIELTNGD